jgi:polyhydroxybutyrate depolymerase
MSPKADAEAFIVVYPEGVDQLWRDGPGSDDVQFVRDLIAHLRGEYTIDPKQIFATGISNGGGMANRVGCDLSEVIAAIGLVSGAYNAWKICKPGRPVPVVAFHGTADNIVPYEGVGLGNAAPPIPEWASAWAERDGCVSTPTTFSQGEVTGETWGNCEAGAEVVLYTIAGKGHSWPGSAMPAQITTRDINATDVIWDFFKSHPMP